MRYCIFSRDDERSQKMSFEISSFLEKDAFFSLDEASPELVIVIGGDGTFLGALHKNIGKIDQMKFLCFNTGTIGYYNEFDVTSFKELIHSIKEKNLPTRAFSLLKYSANDCSHFAINELILSGLIKNVEYEVFLDGEKLEDYFGMGLVISSSTGSMGYNRSINGSIVDIQIDGMQMTEIAAIRSKAYSPIGSPVVFSKDRVLTFKEKNFRSGSLLADNILLEEKCAKEFSISIAQEKVICYSLEKDPFLARVKKTLGF